MPKIALLVVAVLVGIVVVVIAVSYVANIMFTQKVKKEVAVFFSGTGNKAEIVKQSDLEGLPPVVQKWLAGSRVVGKERIVAARSQQAAVMRMKEKTTRAR